MQKYELCFWDTGVSVHPHLIKAGGGGGRWKICRDTAGFLLFANHIRCATGLIRPEMRSSGTRGPLGRARTRREASKTGFFPLISVRGVISMLVGRRSNEEASVLRLQSRFPITSCAVVTLEMAGLLTSSVQMIDPSSWVKKQNICLPIYADIKGVGVGRGIHEGVSAAFCLLLYQCCFDSVGLYVLIWNRII